MLGENPLCSQDATILGFFKKRKTAQVRMGKEDARPRLGSLTASFSPNKSGTRPDHGVAPTKNVQVSHQTRDLRVWLSQILENEFSPGPPVCFQKTISFLS